MGSLCGSSGAAITSKNPIDHENRGKSKLK